MASFAMARLAMVGPVTGCRACGGRLTVTMADLGLQPASNAFLTSLEAARDEKRYPLRAKVCESCKLVQVDYDVAPQELFANYVYFSSYSDDWLAHAKEYCNMARRRFGLDAGSLVVELASNDGYLLKNFIDMGVPVLGHRPVRYRRGRGGKDRRSHPGRVLRRAPGEGTGRRRPASGPDNRQQCCWRTSHCSMTSSPALLCC